MTIQDIKVVGSLISGLFISLIGGLDGLLNLLLFLMAIDIATGLMKGFYLKEINPDKMFLGALKKLTILIVVMISTQVVYYLGSQIPLREIAIMYYVIQEGLSGLENIAIFNSVPTELSDFFEKLKKNEGK